MPTFDMKLDVHKHMAMSPNRIFVRVGDTGSQMLTIHLMDDGSEYTPPDGTSARIDILKADGKWCRNTAELSGSTVTATLSEQAVSSPGDVRLAYVTLVNGSKQESTEGFALKVLHEVDMSGPESENYDGQLQALYDKWRAYEEQAEQQESARQDASEKSVQAANAAADAAVESTKAANYAAEAALSAVTADKKVWLDYDDEGRICMYEVES